MWIFWLMFFVLVAVVITLMYCCLIRASIDVYKRQDIISVINSLVEKKYLKVKDGKYNPVCGNMSFEVFKFLDPNSICLLYTSRCV